MNAMKIIFTILSAMAIVMITITILTSKQRESEQPATDISSSFETHQSVPMQRVNRFLMAAQDNPGRGDNDKFHCNKNATVCSAAGSPGSTCCNNKCVDLANDPKYCGACKNKCKHTETCCGGNCVNLSFDKRHCGSCNNKCMTGGYCIYGLCDYA